MILLLGTTPYYIEIDTVPSSLGNRLATRYSPLTVTATVARPARRCRWEYGGNFITTPEFYGHFSCRPQPNNTQVQITCVREEGIVTSTLTFTEPLHKGALNIRVNCYGSREALPTITIQGT